MELRDTVTTRVAALGVGHEATVDHHGTVHLALDALSDAKLACTMLRRDGLRVSEPIALGTTVRQGLNLGEWTLIVRER
jgi:hypothetical protein